jgi:hypothetical protein
VDESLPVPACLYSLAISVKDESASVLSSTCISALPMDGDPDLSAFEMVVQPTSDAIKRDGDVHQGVADCHRVAICLGSLQSREIPLGLCEHIPRRCYSVCAISVGPNAIRLSR